MEYFFGRILRRPRHVLEDMSHFSMKGIPMKASIVRYRTHPDQAGRNAELVAAVFAALERTRPRGLRYEAIRGADGVSFTHVVSVEEGLAEHPLTSLPEFKAFVEGIRERCAEPPQPAEAEVLGRYTG